MSSMLEEAILNAKELKEAAINSAKQIVIEKYSKEYEKEIERILEQNDPAMLEQPPQQDIGSIAPPADATQMAPAAATTIPPVTTQPVAPEVAENDSDKKSSIFDKLEYAFKDGEIIDDKIYPTGVVEIDLDSLSEFSFNKNRKETDEQKALQELKNMSNKRKNIQESCKTEDLEEEIDIEDDLDDDEEEDEIDIDDDGLDDELSDDEDDEFGSDVEVLFGDEIEDEFSDLGSDEEDIDLDTDEEESEESMEFELDFDSDEDDEDLDLDDETEENDEIDLDSEDDLDDEEEDEDIDSETEDEEEYDNEVDDEESGFFKPKTVDESEKNRKKTKADDKSVKTSVVKKLEKALTLLKGDHPGHKSQIKSLITLAQNGDRHKLKVKVLSFVSKFKKDFIKENGKFAETLKSVYIDLGGSEEELIKETLYLDYKRSGPRSSFNGMFREEAEYDVELANLKAEIDASERDSDSVIRLNKELKEGLKQSIEIIKNLTSENKKLLEKAQKYQHKLQESRILNYKLLYTNKVLSDSSLNERQKNKIAESIKNTRTTEEVKMLYETLESTMRVETKNAPKSLSEAVERRSSSILLKPSRTEEPKQNDKFERMQKIAGIRK